ncbi:hypothetical protein NL676_034793 [Syzygium grande]|nr:hypothetical protein NL676_034793 [Syzygium grande]
MAEVFRKCCLLILLLVFQGWMIEIPKAEELCSVGLGQCKRGNDCQQRCAASHGPASQGSCDFSIHPPLCTCLYDCPGKPPAAPPLPKKCNGSGGLCTLECTDQCCSNRCATKFSNGHGNCDKSAGPWLCQCQYPC